MRGRERKKIDNRRHWMRIGDRIVWLESCVSTNDVAKDLAERGEPEGTAVISKEQTGGRGRLARRWFSSKERGLYVSLLLRPPASNISLLSLAAGVAFCEAVRISCQRRICLKWPNDLLFKGKKLGGILCEGSMIGNHPEYVVLGFGLNVSHEKGDFPDDIQGISTSIKQIIGEDPDSETVLSHLWEQLEREYDLFLRRRSRDITSAFMERSCFPPGAKLTIETVDGTVPGLFCGLDSQGGLILETASERKTYFEAEILSLLMTEEI
jgi:BirA family biotin operon repressor/biotin-[acetyl-CoA-carboxylase] ligase